jgi:hypothetical protein
MLTSSHALAFAAGALFIGLVAFGLSIWRRRCELRRDLDDDDNALQALYLRLKQAERSGSPAAPAIVRSVRASAARLLDMTVELLAQAASAARNHPGIAAEYERGVRAALGTVKGLLDCADALIAPLAGKQRDCAARMLEQVKTLRYRLACQVERCRIEGFFLDEESVRLSMLERGITADEMLVDSDPLQALVCLHKQVGAINEIMASFELKTAKLPQA